MTSAQAVHACNMLIDWVKQQASTPENARYITDLTAIRDAAVEKLRTEVS